MDRRNLAECLPEVLKAIEEADFVGMDMEFSGLSKSADDGCKSIDSIQERWEKTKESARCCLESPSTWASESSACYSSKWGQLLHRHRRGRRRC